MTECRHRPGAVPDRLAGLPSTYAEDCALHDDALAETSDSEHGTNRRTQLFHIHYGKLRFIHSFTNFTYTTLFTVRYK